MSNEITNIGSAEYMSINPPGLPTAVDRATYQAEVDKLREREKALTRESDAIAAARRRLPMVEVDANTALIGPDGPTTLLDAFEGRRHSWRTTSCGTPDIRRKSSAKVAPGATGMSRNCPIFIREISRLRRLPRDHTKKASATMTSWTGKCRGIRHFHRSKHSSSDGTSA